MVSLFWFIDIYFVGVWWLSFRPTEYTVRQLLIEELRRRGVKVTPEISFVSPNLWTISVIAYIFSKEDLRDTGGRDYE